MNPNPGINPGWTPVVPSPLPAQGGNAGLFLTTNGITVSWAQAVPNQTGFGGSYLFTNGTTSSWRPQPGLAMVVALANA